MNDIVDEVLMRKVGKQLVFFIRRRTRKGELLPGSTSEEYSEKPFAMPFGALPKGLGAKVKKNKQDFSPFKTKAGSLWVVMNKGYKHLRELAGKDNDKVDMTWSGSYLRDLSVIAVSNTGTGGESVLGWKSKTNKRLAQYHEVMGAGKSKAKHKILGITPPEEKLLGALVHTEIVKTLKEWAKETANANNN